MGPACSSNSSTIQSGKADPKRPRVNLHGEEAGGRKDDYKDKSKYAPAGRTEERVKEGSLHSKLSERHIGYLQRSFTFPSPIDIDGLTARLRFGLLMMMVPKVEDAKEDSKRISI